MKPKHTPTLIDQLLRDPGDSGRYAPRRLATLTAKRFVFDAAASAFLGTLLRKVGRLVLREHEFARQPYPQTWVELDARAYAIGIDSKLRDPERADTRFGFLYDNGTVYGGVESPDYGPNWAPFTFKLHHPMSFEEELELAQRHGLSRLTFRHALIGHSEAIDSPWWQSGEVDNLVRSHLYVPAPDLDVEQNYTLLASHAGVLKQILAVLLVLTRPGRRVLEFGEEKHRRAIWRGHNMLFMAHHTVRLHIDQSVAMRRFISGIHTGLHRRHHDVRGHWAQTRRHQSSCEHNWDPVDVDHYRCLRCEAKKWWRKDHSRGLIELGTVTKQYEVTP